MRQIKTATTYYLFPSTLYLISALCCTPLLRVCTYAHSPAMSVSVHPLSSRGGEDRGRGLAVALRHSRLETEPSIAAISSQVSLMN